MIRRPPRSTLFPTRRSSDLGDENNQDISALVGKVDIRKLEHFGQNDADAYSYSGGLNRTTQGILELDRKSTRLNSSHSQISYAVFCLKKKKKKKKTRNVTIS